MDESPAIPWLARPGARSWACGSSAPVRDGEVRMRRNYALEPDEVERGYVLTCQAEPVSDAVTVDYDS